MDEFAFFRQFRVGFLPEPSASFADELQKKLVPSFVAKLLQLSYPLFRPLTDMYLLAGGAQVLVIVPS